MAVREREPSPDFATEAMGINQGDVYVLLHPVHTWTRFSTKEELIAALDKELSRRPGISYNFTQPMEMRLDETVSGVKSDLAVKIFGDDFRTLDALSKQALRVISNCSRRGQSASGDYLRRRGVFGARGPKCLSPLRTGCVGR